MFEEFKNIDSSKKELKKFGLTVGAVSVLIGAALLNYGKSSSLYFIGFGVLLILARLVSPSVLKPLQKVWMSIAVLLGMVSTRLILFLLFVFVITPIGFLMRVAGKDFLNEKFEPQKKSYWHFREKREYKKEYSERQF